MKKILNSPDSYATEALAGMCRAYPQYYQLVKGYERVIARSRTGASGKVGLVSGGGSGHLPIFTGYVGPGLLDACANGDVFASPSADEMLAAMRAADSGAGVLQIYGNYGGDVMNFDMARELSDMEGVKSASVILADDVASAPAAEAEKRRGVAGMVFVFKVAGAASDSGMGLADVTAIAQRAADNCRSIGVALSPCTVPQAGKPTFSISDSDIEIGMGIHGEPGIERGPMRPANAIADAMLHPILEDAGWVKGTRLAVLVNSLGATPVEELFILYSRISEQLKLNEMEVAFTMVGRYATSMEMGGASLTLMALDDELETMLNAPAECAFWSV